MDPNFLPLFERISDPHIPLTRKKSVAAVDFRSPERLSDKRTMSYGSLSHRKQGGGAVWLAREAGRD